jgi:hypothetical protein
MWSHLPPIRAMETAGELPLRSVRSFIGPHQDSTKLGRDELVVCLLIIIRRSVCRVLYSQMSIILE